MAEIHELTVLELAAAIRSGELSPVTITDHYLRRIHERNEQTGAFFTITDDLAMQQAKAAEAESAATDKPLNGVPIPIKDLNQVAGVRMTLGSLTYQDNVPNDDDYVVTRLRDAGSIMLGKTATPEFGLPCYTETNIGPPARTAWDLTRSAGGSSGGAGAAVSAGLAPAAQGSDGGGSIRIPSSVCGLFGIKPTRGRVSGGPLMPDLTGLATDGPIARTVADAALLLDVMAGNYPGDMYTVAPPENTFLSYALNPSTSKLRIGRTLQHAIEGAEVHPDVIAAYEDASALIASLGHEVVDIDCPFGPDVVPFFETLWYSHATLAPITPDQVELLRPLTRYLRDRGLATGAADLIFAQAYLQLMTRTGLAVFNQFDAILTPTLAQLPVKVGYFEEVDPAENFERQKRFTPYAALYNVTGQPAVNVPLHWNPDGLPVGVMLAGRMGDEATLISLSAQLEEARPWKDRHPPIW
jgi:amidase